MELTRQTGLSPSPSELQRWRSHCIPSQGHALRLVAANGDKICKNIYSPALHAIKSYSPIPRILYTPRSITPASHTRVAHNPLPPQPPHRPPSQPQSPLNLRPLQPLLIPQHQQLPNSHHIQELPPLMAPLANIDKLLLRFLREPVARLEKLDRRVAGRVGEDLMVVGGGI